MSNKELLTIISKQWCNLNDLMLIGNIGRNSALKIRKKIKEKLEKEGYIVPNNLIPMNAVVKFLNIDIDYLERRSNMLK